MEPEEQKLEHVTAGRPKINRRKKKKKRRGLRKAFNTGDEAKKSEFVASKDTIQTVNTAAESTSGAAVAPESMTQDQMKVFTKFSLPTMKFQKADAGNVLSLVEEMEEGLNRLIIAEKKLEVLNHNLRTDVNLMRQKTLRLEEEFCYRYPSSRQDEAKIKKFVQGDPRVMTDSKSKDGIRYLHGLVNFHNTRHWKTRYFVLTGRFVEVYKSDKLPASKIKPNQVFDLADATVTEMRQHPGYDRPCMKLTATKKNQVAMFYCNTKNDNLAWRSGISNRRLQCMYENQCAQLRSAPSSNIINFLSRWRFASAPVTLDMSGKNLDVLAAGIIQRCLSDPSHPSIPIATLNLAGCNINDMKMNDVCVGLFKNTTVQIIDLSKTSMTPNMSRSLAKAIETNYKNGGALKTLKLNECKFESKASECLVEGLCKSGLSSVSLKGCHLDSKVAVAIASGLKAEDQMKTLTNLDLSGNVLDDEGAKELADALIRNSILKVLNLNGNEIGDEGGEALAKALRSNTTLSSLSFQGNPIGEKATTAFTYTAQKSTGLQNLAYGENVLNRQHMSVMHLLHKYGFADEKKQA
mmetsp:Transcript_23549/g.35238  ORF Transcript_23549/g.35238 Transcript_23549/m.35238 type:complete len:578 (-) Transcript_23549:133-1866(-)